MIRCPTCHRIRSHVAPCPCDRAEAAQAREADRWASSHGESIPSPNRKLGLCGDVLPTAEMVASVLEGQGGAVTGHGEMRQAEPGAGHPLRHYRDWLEARLIAVRYRLRSIQGEVPELEAEAARLELHEKLLRWRFDGDGLAQVCRDRGLSGRGKGPYAEMAARLGISKTKVCDLMAEIDADASARYRERGSVAVACRSCRKPIVTIACTGRPRLYCSQACRWRNYDRGSRVRRRVAREVSRESARIDQEEVR